MERSSSYINGLDGGAAAGEPAAEVAQAPPFQPRRPTLTRRQLRIRGLVVAAPIWAAVVVAAWLIPSPTGVGTHSQLGLPPCEFLARTGWPCPSCGLTTSLAAMAHGKVLSAWRAHPFGIVLFAGCVAVGVAGAAEALAGRSVLHLLRPGVWWAWTTVIGVVAGWGLRILLGVADGTLPMR